MSFGAPATTSSTLSFGAPAAATQTAAPVATATATPAPAFGASNTLSFGAPAAKPVLPTFGASIQQTNASTAPLSTLPTGKTSNKIPIVFFQMNFVINLILILIYSV